MKINTTSSQKRNIATIISIVTLLLISLVVLEKTRMTDMIKDPTYRDAAQGPTEEEIKKQEQAQAEQKADFLDKNSQEENAKPAEVPTDTETITLNFVQEGEALIIHNELHGQGYSSGICKLTVQNGTASTAHEAQIIYQPEYSTCAGFSVPVDTLGAGIWTVKLEVTPLNGETLTKSTTFEVKP